MLCRSARRANGAHEALAEQDGPGEMLGMLLLIVGIVLPAQQVMGRVDAILIEDLVPQLCMSMVVADCVTHGLLRSSLFLILQCLVTYSMLSECFLLLAIKNTIHHIPSIIS